MALIWAWLSDGPCRGARWPFIYIGAISTVSQNVLFYLTIDLCMEALTSICHAQLIVSSLMMKMPFYTNIKSRMIVYWLSNIGVGFQFFTNCLNITSNSNKRMAQVLSS